MGRLSVVGSLAAVAFLALQANAQAWSNVTCIDQLWSLNSLEQTPCLVSAYLSAQCTTDNYWGVPEIGTDGPYSPPSGVYANICRCNSVQWNLLSACSMCQGGPSGSWASWISNCTASVVNIGKYPEPIPAGVSVPHWAYYDFTGTGVFNAVIAQQQTGPESSAVGGATATSRTTATSGVGENPSATPLPANGAKSSSNTGAIAGGVVGGVLGLALIALIAFVLVRKNKKDKTEATTDQYAQGGYNPPVGGLPDSAAPMMGQYQPGVQHPGMASPGMGYKAYDPSDPSTFPTPSNNAPSHYPESLQYSQNASQYRPGHYSGAPEV